MESSISNRQARIRNMIIGAALGDAMGLIAEITPNKTWPPPASTNIRDITAGDWSDDTDQAIVTMRAVIAADKMTASKATADNATDDGPPLSTLLNTLAGQLHEWSKTGFPELGDKKAAGLSGSLALTLKDPNFAEQYWEVSMEVWKRSRMRLALNGSMVRAVPAACLGWERASTSSADNQPPAAAIWAQLCSITHSDPRVIYSFVWYAQLLAALIDGARPNNAFIMAANALEQLDELMRPSGDDGGAATTDTTDDNNLSQVCMSILEVVERSRSECLANLQIGEVGRTAHVIKCLSAAAYTAQVLVYADEQGAKPSYHKTIDHIAAAGGDTTANCAVAGAILGVYIGEPEGAVSMKHYEWLVGEINKFIETL